MEHMFRIEICGEIGAGKTTLANILRTNGYNVVFDKFSINPFWNNLFEQPKEKNLFELEICFALLHYNAVRNSNNIVTICDWSVYQDFSYAKVNLTEKEYKAFWGLYSYILQDIGYPQLVVYFRCPAETLLQRIALRGREQDQCVSKEYLEVCIERLEHSLSTAEKVIIIDSDQVDYANSDEGKEYVLNIFKEVIETY